MSENALRDSKTWLLSVRQCCSRLCPASNSVLAGHGINLPQFNAMCILAENDTMTMSELTSKLGVTMGAGTSLMDKLVQADVASRVRSTEDRRVVNVGLTQKGAGLLERATADLVKFWSEILGRIDPDKRRGLFEAHHKIIELTEKAMGKKFRAMDTCA
jgi:DNA-binding MarR family transcriptional regulator